jgi:HAMP domain-containing protein
VFKSIALNFFVVLLGIVVLAFLVLNLWIGNLVKNIQIEQSKTVVSDFVQIHSQIFLQPESFVFGSKEASPEKFTHLLNDLGGLDVVRIKVWDTQSRVIFSDDESIIGKTFPENEELRESLGGHVEAEIQEPIKPENVKEVGYNQLLELYVPIYFEPNPQPVGVIEAYFSLDGVNRLLSKIRMLIFVAMVSVILSLLAAVWFLFWFLVRKRLAVLSNTARKFAEGDLEELVVVNRQDEIGELGTTFNFMAVKLRELYENMEQKVQDRTKALEKDNKIMIGRELKMVEFKKEIENLKKQIKKGSGNNEDD